MSTIFRFTFVKKCPPPCTFISGWDVMLLKVKIIQDVFFVLFEGTEVILPPTSPGLGDAEEDGAG